MDYMESPVINNLPIGGTLRFLKKLRISNPDLLGKKEPIDEPRIQSSDIPDTAFRSSSGGFKLADR
jgi:hypothetical protein